MATHTAAMDAVSDLFDLAPISLWDDDYATQPILRIATKVGMSTEMTLHETA